MGQEIEHEHFDDEDAERFRLSLREETKILKSWFDQERFAVPEQAKCGLEVEAWLIGPDHEPAPRNVEFLDKLSSKLVVPELSRFNFEINTPPYDLSGGFLGTWQADFDRLWASCQEEGRAIGLQPLTIGILPTVGEHHLTGAHMSPLNRYAALNEQLFRLRKGAPMEIDIEGDEHLHLTRDDVMLEAACTSIQIHVQLDQKTAARQFNAAQIVSAPVLAATANAPFLFGRQLWEETRIPLFEQSVSVRSFKDAQGRKVGRVTFGTGYIRHSLLELYLENLDAYPVLLPIDFESEPERMAHLRLQNGTIWRWNRPIVDFNPDGRPHLRIEHRVMPAGPTIEDMVANTALFLGLHSFYSTMDTPPEEQIPFEAARANFYDAARVGLDARLDWIGGRGSARSLLLDRLLGEAAEGLRRLDIDEAEISHYLQGIVASRIASGQTGAQWQRKFVARYGPDFGALTGVYLEKQAEGQPVHSWTL